MDEIFEISSDSNETIISPINNKTDNDIELDNIVNKYLLNTIKTTPKKITYDLNDSSDDEYLPSSPSSKRIRNCVSPLTDHNIFENLINDSINNAPSTSFSSQPLSISDQELIPPPKALTKKEKNKQEKEAIRIQKQQERAKKKEELEREKAVKRALKLTHKNLLPNECLKFMTVYIDNEIANTVYGKDILNVLQESEISHKIQSQLIPNTVTWSRNGQSHWVDDDGTVNSSSQSSETEEALLIMNWKDFVNYVNDNSLTPYIQSILSVLNKKISLAVYGLESYFKYWENVKNCEHRSRITGNVEKAPKNQKIYSDAPKVSTDEVETALVEIQILHCCSCRMLSSGMGSLVLQFTKAIAQLPYKLQKQEKNSKLIWFAAKNCVKIDKDGNGLSRLWQQVLTTFPSAGLEAAEAIASKYPTPLALMEAYEQCTTQLEGEQLLQSIPIRRAAGPLTSTRKIHSTLSKKIYNFFTSLDGDFLL